MGEGVSPLQRRWASRGGREPRSAKDSPGLSSGPHSWGLRVNQRGKVRGSLGWRQVAKDGSESPRPGSLVRAVVAGWVAASACCGVVSAGVVGGGVVWNQRQLWRELLLWRRQQPWLQ